MVTQWKTLKGRSKDSQPVPFQLFLPRRDLDLIMINAEEQRFIPIINSPIACSVSIIILGIIYFTVVLCVHVTVLATYIMH